MPGSKFEDLQEQFNNTYSIRISVKDTERTKNTYALLGGLFSAGESKKSPLNKYVALLSSAFATYLNTHSKIDASRSYERLSQFNMEGFIRSFEGMMQARYEESLPEGETPKRKPYEKANFASLLERMVQFTRQYNKSLASLWAEQVKEGTMDVETIKQFALEDAQFLVRNANNANVSQEEKDNRLKHFVTARQAIDTLWEKRGYGWIILHPIQAYREYDLLNTLNDIWDDLEEYNYPLNDMEGQVATSHVLGGAIEQANEAVDRIRQEREQAKQIKAERNPMILDDLGNNVNEIAPQVKQQLQHEQPQKRP
jgi:hypothetical protein